VRVCGCFTPRQIKHAEDRDSTVRFNSPTNKQQALHNFVSCMREMFIRFMWIHLCVDIELHIVLISLAIHIRI